MKVLLIVDLQAVFMVNQKLKQLPKAITNLILSGKFDKVVGIRFLNKKNSPFVKQWNWTKAMSNDKDSSIDETIIAHCDFTYTKFGFSGYTAKLKQWFKEVGFKKEEDKLYICGLDTDLCVQQTCADLFIHNFDVYVLAQYCGSDAGVIYHQAGLTVLTHMLGAKKIIYNFS